MTDLPWPEDPATGLPNIPEGVITALQAFAAAIGRLHSDVVDQAETFRRLVPLGPRGWAISTYGIALAREAHHAASLEPDLDAAGTHLLRGWSDPTARELLCTLVPYAYPAEGRAIATRRQELLARASRNAEQGRHAEAVLLVYSQLDGLFADRAQEDGERGFGHVFRKQSPRAGVRQFTDIVGEAATPTGIEPAFRAARELIAADVRETTLEDRPSRHGLLHGRVLGYDTALRAAQAFAFLAACVELLIATRPGVLEALEQKIPFLDEGGSEARSANLATSYAVVHSVYVHSAQDRPLFTAWSDTPERTVEDEAAGSPSTR